MHANGNTHGLCLGALCLAIVVCASAPLRAQDQTDTAALSATPAPTGPKAFNVEEWHVPEAYGTIKEMHRGDKGTIVHIQDAHCNFEAQSNNANILRDLVKTYGVDLVHVEGSTGRIDTTPFAQFPDKDIKTEVATYFMKKGRITGPEYLSITSDLEFTIYGIEDPDMYKINYDAFIRSLEYRDEVAPMIAELTKYAELLKANLFSPELKEMDKHLADYKSNAVTFTAFADYLAATAAKVKLDLGAYPNFVRQREAKALEDKIDFKAVDGERTRLISRLEKQLSKKHMSELVVSSLSFRMGKISPFEFYSALQDLSAKARIGLRRYKNLSRYIEQLALYEQIDSAVLFEEGDRLAQDIQEQLFQNADQSNLAHVVKDLHMLDDLFELKLSTRDLRYYRANKGALQSSRFVRFFQGFANQYGIPYLDGDRYSDIDKKFYTVEQFYEAAEARDKILIENTIRNMESEGESLTVMVTGGFHSDGITGLMRKHGYSFVVVTPRITDLDAPNYYEDVMTNKKTPFEELLGAAE